MQAFVGNLTRRKHRRSLSPQFQYAFALEVLKTERLRIIALIVVATTVAVGLGTVDLLVPSVLDRIVGPLLYFIFIILSTLRLDFSPCAMREMAGSAAAAAARCRKFRRGSFILNLPLASHHSITSSAMVSSEGGTVRPNMRAVVLLMTSSNLVDCATGKSPGFAPLSTRPA
jgi:hypothetical protein